jgi:hypothetical protein
LIAGISRFKNDAIPHRFSSCLQISLAVSLNKKISLNLLAMKHSGTADLPLHYGAVPSWLAERMATLGMAITESILMDYGKASLLSRMSDPFWFQSLGAVMGMDWHSSGITTSVMGALKKAINPRAKEWGIYVCGGKGKSSTQTPVELVKIAETTGLDANALVRCSKLSAKVDNTAVQDGFHLYIHCFMLSDAGDWTVIQQGMRTEDRTARRYHWHSAGLQSFVVEPHTGICGINQGSILNLTAVEAGAARQGIMEITREHPERIIPEIQRLIMPTHHEVRSENVDLRKLGSILWLAYDKQPKDFEALLSLQGIGPRALQSLALVSEVIHGTPSRFRDPARFSFAHGGKDGHPFPVPLKVYDETIQVLQTAVNHARIGWSHKQAAIKSLSVLAQRKETDFLPQDNFAELVEKERAESWRYGGRTVWGDATPPPKRKNTQLRLF